MVYGIKGYLIVYKITAAYVCIFLQESTLFYAYLHVLMFTYVFIKYENMLFIKYDVSHKYKYVFVKYISLMGKYAHAWPSAHRFFAYGSQING